MSAVFLAAAIGLSLLAAVLVAVPLWVRATGEGGATGRRIGAAALVLLLPLVVLSVYTQVSSYPWDNPERLTAPPPGTPEQIASMVNQLADRMAAEPTVEGLVMLGRSYVALDRLEEGIDAYHRAWEMTGGEDPAISVAYAEALILVDRETILTSAGDLLDTALQQMPYDPKALWYGGLSAMGRGQLAVAQQRFATLLNNPDIPDELRTVVQAQMAAMSAETGAAGNGMPAAAAETSLTITVDIDAGLASQAGSNPVMFVFARENGRPGPPVAVKRLRVQEFPVKLVLSDADAMVAGRTLGDIGELQLTARLSATENAIAASGDLYGDTVSADWQTAGSGFTILIDSVVD